MQAIKKLRKKMSAMEDHQVKVMELLSQNLEFSRSAAMQRPAKDLIDQDTLAVDIPWSSVEQVETVMASPSLRESLTHVLMDPLIPRDHHHFFSAAMKRLFTADYRGCLYVGTPKG